MKVIFIILLIAVSTEQRHLKSSTCTYLNLLDKNAISNLFSDKKSAFEFTWTVTVSNTNKNSEPVKGILIHESFVLTLASAIVDNDASQLNVRTGNSNPWATDDPSLYQNRSVANIVVHPGYKNENNPTNNLALLFLDEPLNLHENVSAACLPDEGQNYENANCISSKITAKLTGYEIQVFLEPIEITTVPITECQNIPHGKIELDGSFICTRDINDSLERSTPQSSPLVCPLSNNRNLYTQVGILLEQIKGDNQVLDVFVDFNKSYSWINETLSSYGFTLPASSN